MEPAWFLLPGSLDVRTGGSIYDRRVVEGLRALGRDVHVQELDTSFPAPTPAALAGARDALREIPDGSLVVVDGLAYSAMPDLAEAEAERLRLVALVHLPRAADPTVRPDCAEAVRSAECRAVAAARLVIATGSRTPGLLAGCAPGRPPVLVVPPGTDRREPRAPRSAAGPVQVLCVATLNPGKGHDRLLRALAATASGQWRLACAGSLTRDPRTAARIRALSADLGVDEQVEFLGDLEGPALDAAWRRADVFALATRMETYGMAVAEALSYGLPVVSTDTGDIAAMVGSEAGLVVSPDDEQGLGHALARIISDGELRMRLAEGARRSAARLPTWPESAARFSAALDGVPRHV